MSVDPSATQLSPGALDAYVDMMSVALSLPIPAECRDGVRRNLAMILDVGSVLVAPLDGASAADLVQVLPTYRP